jgi:hypothetical protein
MKNRIGEKYGNLTIINFSHTEKKEYNTYTSSKNYWVCKCVCGNEKCYSLDKLTQGLRKTCGCGNGGFLQKERKNHINCHVKKQSLGYYQEIRISYLHHIKRGAEKRNLIYDLTIEYLWNLYLNQNKKCALSGVNIMFGSAQKQTASLDRINSNIGYVVGNVQWVDKNINLLKGDVTNDTFIKLCTDVAIYNKKP